MHRGCEWADKGLELLAEALADAGTSGAELARVAGERLKVEGLTPLKNRKEFPCAFVVNAPQCLNEGRLVHANIKHQLDDMVKQVPAEARRATPKARARPAALRRTP